MGAKQSVDEHEKNDIETRYVRFDGRISVLLVTNKNSINSSKPSTLSAESSSSSGTLTAPREMPPSTSASAPTPAPISARTSAHSEWVCSGLSLKNGVSTSRSLPAPRKKKKANKTQRRRTGMPKSILKGTRSSVRCRLYLFSVIGLVVLTAACDLTAYVNDTWTSVLDCEEYGLLHRRLNLSDECVDLFGLTPDDLPRETYTSLSGRLCGNPATELQCKTFRNLNALGFSVLFVILLVTIGAAIIVILCLLLWLFVSTTKYLTKDNLCWAKRAVKVNMFMMTLIFVVTLGGIFAWAYYSRGIIVDYEAQRHGIKDGIDFSMSFFIVVVADMLCVVVVFVLWMVYREFAPPIVFPESWEASGDYTEFWKDDELFTRFVSSL